MDRDITQTDFDADFSRVSPEQLRKMTEDFLDVYATPKTKFVRRVDLSYSTLDRWLTDKEPLSQKSLKRIFEFLRENFPKWIEYID